MTDVCQFEVVRAEIICLLRAAGLKSPLIGMGTEELQLLSRETTEWANLADGHFWKARE
jgi:hypothetical protein